VTDETKRSDPATDSGAYVLNALDASERDAFEVRLEHSEELRNEVTELTDTAVLLGMAVDPVTPSAELKSDIMSKIATMPQLPRDVAPVRELYPTGAASPAPVALSRKAQLRWFNRPIIAITSAAAAVALLIGGGVAVGIANQAVQHSQVADALAAINSAADVQHAAASVSTGGKATLVWSLSQRKSALIVTGLGAAPGGKTYELWYIDGKGVATPAGLFSANGQRILEVLDGRMSKGDTVGVTIEPSGGSKAPTTKPIVAIPSA
jgi:anti-sigma-K factor RskA